MANPKHLNILKQGVTVWNQWRAENTEITPNLTKADLTRANLSGANLTRADLGGAALIEANLSGANLIEANLNRAALIEANLTRAALDGADFSQASLGVTVFGDTDLSVAIGLEAVRHVGPSTIGIDTLYRSKGKIPEVFLRGAGVPENFITYMKSLTGEVLEFYSCFISYSSKDQAFADRLYADLQARKVRCWFAPEDMKIGDPILDRIDWTIRVYDKLLLILSENSIGSDWVEDEVNIAFEEERKRKTTVLFPIRLDESVMNTPEAWAAKVRQRHIGDFRRWKQHDNYEKTFQRLLRDLKGGSQTYW